jgi:beta-lactamase class D
MKNRFKNSFLLFTFLLLFSNYGFAVQECFLVKEKGRVLIEEGKCKERHNPGCDFSIVLSLMGFDSGVLIDENNLKWPYQEGYETFLNVWKRHTRQGHG